MTYLDRILLKHDDSCIDTLNITDEGIGIDEKDLEVIFEKFMRLNQNLNRRAEGNGLVLLLAKSIANLQGGLSVESALNRGNKFTLELPYILKKNILKNDNRSVQIGMSAPTLLANI